MERVLGWLALLLLGLIGWAVERLQGRTLIADVAARLVLGCVTVVGWVFDRLPVPDPHRENEAQMVHRSGARPAEHRT